MQFESIWFFIYFFEQHAAACCIKTLWSVRIIIHISATLASATPWSWLDETWKESSSSMALVLGISFEKYIDSIHICMIYIMYIYIYIVDKLRTWNTKPCDFVILFLTVIVLSCLRHFAPWMQRPVRLHQIFGIFEPFRCSKCMNTSKSHRQYSKWQVCRFTKIICSNVSCQLYYILIFLQILHQQHLIPFLMFGCLKRRRILTF